MKDLLKKEILLQWRQGFWLIYFIVSIIYVIILLNIPRENRMVVSLIMILSDTTMLGVMFVGALVLLEKQQNVIQAFFVTPLKPSQYIWSKTLSLSLIAFSMSILIYLPVAHFSGYTLLILLTTAITAGIFAMLGLGISARLRGINDYFGVLMGASMLIALPIIPYLLWDQHPVLLCLPYIASLDLMLGAFDPIPPWRILLDLCLLSAWGAAAFFFCRKQVIKHLVYQQ